MLPVWYTTFHETSVTGVPVLQLHYVVFPKDLKGSAVDDQYFIGASGILVKPITTKGATETTVYLAEDEVYYNYFSHHVYRGATKGKEISVKAELHQVPVFVHGGSIVPTRERPRRSSPLMKLDPFTLRVALSKVGSAREAVPRRRGHALAREGAVCVARVCCADGEEDDNLQRQSSLSPIYR
jgi:alpha 1,3-glucosidase